MKNKYHILLVAFLMCSTAVFAQQSGSISSQPRIKEEGKIVHNPHWFLSVQGGGAYTVGEAGFGDLLSPSIAISLGYKFTPLFGLRAEASGWQAKGGWVTPTTTDTYFPINLNMRSFHMRNIWKSMLVKVGTSIIPFSLECEKSQKGDLNTKIVLVKVLF